MPVPLFWLGASIVGAYAAKSLLDEQSNKHMATPPGKGFDQVKPVDGAIVCCGVYEFFDHSGIWLDGNIIELRGNGLIRGISPSRFLADRSGEQLYVACDQSSRPLVYPGTQNRASNRLYDYEEYDVINNNCHKFVWQCISGKQETVTRFSELNHKMREVFEQDIHWQTVRQ